MPGPTEVQQARRDNGPITDRGAVRKRQLIAAARRVFEEKGFVEAKVSDIVKEAKVSHGTFYTYFDTKESIFTAVAHEVIAQMLSAMTVSIPSTDLDERVHDLIRRFVHAYRPHATMLGLMEQVGTFSPDMRELRLAARDSFVQRTRRGLQRMKVSGSIDPNLDFEYVAESLGAMLEYTCYIWFCLDKDFEEDRLVDALACVWSKTLASP